MFESIASSDNSSTHPQKEKSSFPSPHSVQELHLPIHQEEIKTKGSHETQQLDSKVIPSFLRNEATIVDVNVEAEDHVDIPLLPDSEELKTKNEFGANIPDFNISTKPMQAQQKNVPYGKVDQDDSMSIISEASFPFAFDQESIQSKEISPSQCLQDGMHTSVHATDAVTEKTQLQSKKATPKLDASSLSLFDPFCCNNDCVGPVHEPELERSPFDSSMFLLRPFEETTAMASESDLLSKTENESAIQQSFVRSNLASDMFGEPEPTLCTETNESLNFSRLLKEADAGSSIIDTCASYQQIRSDGVGNVSKRTITSSYTQLESNTHSGHPPHGGLYQQNTMNFSKTHNQMHNGDNSMTLESNCASYRRPDVKRLSSHSFQISISLHNTTVREAMDVVGNPDLLRFWCESIDALVVTDYKGGMGSSSPKNSSIERQDAIDQRCNEANMDEYDDDVIVPPGLESETDAKRQKANTNEKRQQYDGEWIQASTSEIIPPAAHTNIVEGAVRKTREMFGFNNYGSVSMFIERNLNQVGFTVGPFKGNISLSHKIMLREIKSTPEGVTLIDEVRILNGNDDEYGGRVLCACFDPIKEIISEWFAPGIDGYVDQSQKSLMNLVDLIDRGGENCGGQLILAGASDGDILRTPLLV